MLSGSLMKTAGEEKRERGRYYPRPSMAGPERCIRQNVYWAAGVPEDRLMGDRMVVVLDDSSWHEELTADRLRKSAFRLHSSQMAVNCARLDFLPPETVTCRICGEDHDVRDLHGHIDGIITDVFEIDRLWEHKALNHFTFERYQKGDAWPMDYITQCCLYVKGLRRVNPHITEAVLQIKNKNTSAYMDYVIEYVESEDVCHVKEIELSSGGRSRGNPSIITFENIIKGVVTRFEAVHDYTARKVLPKRPYSLGTTFPCGYCGWEETCFKGIAKEVASMEVVNPVSAEIAALMRDYITHQQAEAAAKAKKEDIKDVLKGLLWEQGINKGYADNMTLTLSIQERTSIDESLISPDVLPTCKKKTQSEILRVTERKPKQ